MSTAPQPQAASPAIVFDTLNAYQRTEALRAAIELDLFTAIAEGNTTLSAIAARIQASEKGTRVLSDFLAIIGFLTKQDGHYGLTSESAAFLNRHSPAYMGTMFSFLKLTAGYFGELSDVVRKGGTLKPSQGIVEVDNPMWVEFARSMAPLMRMPAQLIAGILGADTKPKWKVLDIAAGHGLFGIALAAHNPNAEIVALDWDAVLNVAVENAAKAGVGDRYTKLSGDAFEVEYGTGYDVVLLTNFLHHFSIATNDTLLRKIHIAMAPGGRVVTLEFVPNDDRVTPPLDAQFSMMMLGATEDGDAYTFAEYDRMFRNTGFARSELRELSPLPQRVIVSYK